MLVGFFFFLLLIHFTTSSSNQEDLSISKYSHIGCLTLNSDKQYLINSIQTNSLLAYQTFSSSNMTIDLCFRLCRKRIILINPNHTKCICLYTLNKPSEFNTYLGETSSINNCTLNDLQIYSLTKDFYLLPSLSSSYEWSLDGCYYLHGIQTPNLFLTSVTHTEAIDLCRKHCQSIRNTNYFSFFLSLKQSCYCSPINLSKTVLHTAVRKPLVHCSFLSYIKNSFDYFLNYSEINSDTVVKIDVQRYCSLTFIFDRYLYLCVKLSLLNIQSTYSNINSNEFCSPILIKTSEQWKHLISFSFVLNTRTWIPIDRNSTYIFDDLFKYKGRLSTSDNNLCVIINQINSNRLPSYDLVQCSTARWPGYVLCAQKPLETISPDKTKFRLVHNEEQYSVVNNLSCPSEFVLFNNICYYVDISLVYNRTTGEDLCSKKYSNSSLAKLNSHEWRNINTTNFLGRTVDDILLEFFYYQLEKKLEIQSHIVTNKKHWLRLLLVDKSANKECSLRYFIRSAGAFTILSKCDQGGHPVCQCKAIRNDIPKIIPIDATTASSLPITIRTESTTATTTATETTIVTTTTQITFSMLLTSTNLSIVSNETLVPSREPISDEDLVNNETNTDYTSVNKTLIQSKNQHTNYPPLLMIITVLLSTLVVSILGIAFVVRYFRRSRGSYSTRSNTVGPSRRIKRSSTSANSTDASSTPSVLYSRLKSPPPSIKIDADMVHPFDNSIISDDSVQLLPQPIQFHENIIPEDDEEPLYATLKLPNEK